MSKLGLDLKRKNEEDRLAFLRVMSACGSLEKGTLEATWETLGLWRTTAGVKDPTLPLALSVCVVPSLRINLEKRTCHPTTLHFPARVRDGMRGCWDLPRRKVDQVPESSLNGGYPKTSKSLPDPVFPFWDC